jgi:beta-lactamase family protein
MNPQDMLHKLSISRRQALIGGSAGIASVSLGLPRSARVAAAQDATPAAALTWDEFDQMLAAAAPQAAALAVEIVDDTLVEIHSYEADTVTPVGSSFKWYVLGTVAQQIEQGTLDWEQIVKIEDDHKSVPGGDLRYAPNGSPFTVRYLAERMIQKSDNTATDALIYLVGRENVEAMMTTMGHHDPSLNIPLFTTREFAMIKFAASAEVQQAYLAADVAERRRILTEEIDPMPYEALAVADNQTAPVELFTVEWFATRNDLAKAINYLRIQSLKDGLKPITEVISLETQLVFNGEVWPYVGFKGGSELGLVNGSWLMERADERWFIYSISFANGDEGLNIATIVPVMEAGRDILAVTP